MSEPASVAVGRFAQGCGVLRHSPPAGDYRHVRYAPAKQLGGWVEHFWLETWDFSAAQIREMLPHPSVHLVFAPGRSRIYGVHTGRFVRELQGQGRILGVKFLPGAFYPFLGEPVCSIADTSVPAVRVFAGATDAEQKVLACHDDHGMIEAATLFLVANLPRPDPNTEAARLAVDEIARDRTLARVHQLANRVGVHERTLQRLFRRYVGASPRWVINRYRVYEALEHLTEGNAAPLADLAQTLGYFDQAHFTNVFKRLTGVAPAQYARPGRARVERVEGQGH